MTREDGTEYWKIKCGNFNLFVFENTKKIEDWQDDYVVCAAQQEKKKETERDLNS